MSGIGPALPPHLLAKRKRKEDDAPKDEPVAASGAKREKSPDEPDKRRRVIGPAMPPASLDERPSAPANQDQESESEDDDDFGPSLPTNGLNEVGTNENTSADPSQPAQDTAISESKPKRDEWMTMAPKQDDLAARMDPTKQRARGFNTGKGARAPNASSGEDNSTWHETAGQKQKRLADEMMGVAKPASIGPARATDVESARQARDEAEAKQIREKTERTRGPSLMEQHKTQKGSAVEDDDPSKRAFDREKDMAAGGRVGHAQRNEMLKKAAGFSSKFSGGSYL